MTSTIYTNEYSAQAEQEKIRLEKLEQARNEKANFESWAMNETEIILMRLLYILKRI